MISNFWPVTTLFPKLFGFCRKVKHATLTAVVMSVVIIDAVIIAALQFAVFFFSFLFTTFTSRYFDTLFRQRNLNLIIKLFKNDIRFFFSAFLCWAWHEIFISIYDRGYHIYFVSISFTDLDNIHSLVLVVFGAFHTLQ